MIVLFHSHARLRVEELVIGKGLVRVEMRKFFYQTPRFGLHYFKRLACGFVGRNFKKLKMNKRGECGVCERERGGEEVRVFFILLRLRG